MKNIFISLGTVSALAIAAPSAAQNSGQGYANQNRAAPGANFEARLERLEARLRAGVQRGAISRQAGWNLSQQIDALENLHDRYSGGGLNQTERQDLNQRLRQLRQQIRIAGGNGWNRDERWDDDDDGGWGQPQQGGGNWGQPQQGRIDRNNDGFDDRDYDRDGRIDDDRSNRIDRNNDGFDDRDYDRDGRWDDDVNNRIDRDRDGFDDRDRDRDGRWDDDVNNRIDRDRDGYDDRDRDRDGRWDDDVSGGTYPQQQQPQQDRGVIGNLIDTFLGGSGSSLRVGDAAPANLGAVPYAYQNQFRDGNGVYYRSDGRAIYQIDARTRTVARIYAMPAR